MSPAAVVAKVAIGLNGKVFRLRHLVAQSTVKYDEAGQLLGHQEPGDWTLHNQLEITDIGYKDQTLFITGNRVVITFEDGNGPPRSLPTSKTAEIRIKTSKTASFDIEKELLKAFLAATEKVPENLPAYWDRFVRCGPDPAEDCPLYAPARSLDGRGRCRRTSSDGIQAALLQQRSS